jgi:hypothetical protein
VVSGLVAVIVGGVCWGKESFLGCCYLMEDLSSSVPIYGILHIVNGLCSHGNLIAHVEQSKALSHKAKPVAFLFKATKMSKTTK